MQSEASRGLYCQTFKKVVSFRWRSSRLPEKSVSATVRFTSLSTDRERGGWLRLHMLYSEEKSVREAGIQVSHMPIQSAQIGKYVPLSGQ